MQPWGSIFARVSKDSYYALQSKLFLKVGNALGVQSLGILPAQKQAGRLRSKINQLYWGVSHHAIIPSVGSGNICMLDKKN